MTQTLLPFILTAAVSGPPASGGPAPAPEKTVTDVSAATALGYTLFFDKRLSKDGSMSCESCHHPDRAWTDPAALNAKVGGAMNKRNAPTVQNMGLHQSYYWDGRAPTLEAVSLAAWKGQLGADPAEVAKRLNGVPAYVERFKKAFGSEATPENVPQALAHFFRALKSENAPFDRFVAGDKKALNASAQRGWDLFSKQGCVTCHTPPLFSDQLFHNVGVGTQKPEAEQDQGRTDATKDPADKGKFKTPSLRDVARTSPYFHDGSAAKLEDAIQFMVDGGLKNPNLDPALTPRKLSAKDKADLKAFLESLSGVSTYTKAPGDIPN